MRKVYQWIQGASGMGKTLAAKAVAGQRARAGGRLVVVDPNSVFDGYGRPVTVREGIELLRRAAAAPTAPLAIVLRPGWDEDIGSVWKHVFNAGRLLLLVDEAAQYASNEAGALDRDFVNLCIKGRNQYIDMITTSQAPTTLHPQVRSLWDVYLTFRQSEPRYAEEIARKYFRNPALAAPLLTLPKFCYLRATVEGGVSRGTVSLPENPPFARVRGPEARIA